MYIRSRKRSRPWQTKFGSIQVGHHLSVLLANSIPFGIPLPLDALTNIVIPTGAQMLTFSIVIRDFHNRLYEEWSHGQYGMLNACLFLLSSYSYTFLGLETPSNCYVDFAADLRVNAADSMGICY
jgi:hypothetical protein